MNPMEPLKKLKQDYERLRDQYLLTRKPHHYFLFQSAFQSYRSFIDLHKITPGCLEKMMAQELPEEFVPGKPPLSRRNALESQKKILMFLSSREDWVSVRVLELHVPLRGNQIRNHLHSLQKQGWVEHQRSCGIGYWRKKQSSVLKEIGTSTHPSPISVFSS